MEEQFKVPRRNRQFLENRYDIKKCFGSPAGHGAMNLWQYLLLLKIVDRLDTLIDIFGKIENGE